MLILLGASPGTEASTTISLGAERTCSGGNTSKLGLTGVSKSICLKRRRCSDDDEASMVVRTKALARPWYAGVHAARLGERLAGSPLCVAQTLPGPDTTRNVTLLSEAGTTIPWASTRDARTMAVSWPSSTSAEPVPVRADGASRVRTTEATLPAVVKVWLARSEPCSPAIATALSLPARYCTEKVAIPKKGTGKGEAAR
mmetsp:Transcript_26557/g.52342  ORF Transcript_26557/g.52342 Transcript_26557/m.52342 type:complete len:200 (-) Transcript_26557:2351-2950(-)